MYCQAWLSHLLGPQKLTYGLGCRHLPGRVRGGESSGANLLMMSRIFLRELPIQLHTAPAHSSRNLGILGCRHRVCEHQGSDTGLSYLKCFLLHEQVTAMLQRQSPFLPTWECSCDSCGLGMKKMYSQHSSSYSEEFSNGKWNEKSDYLVKNTMLKM